MVIQPLWRKMAFPVRKKAETRTHEKDDCKATLAYQAIRAAANKFPITVIETPASGPRSECWDAPAPHFFSGVEAEFADAVLRWADKIQ
jgi:hypothetical protein